MASMGDAQRVGNGGLSKLTDGPRTTSDLSKVGGGLTRGPNQGKKLAAAAWSETWPAPQSTLDLDFANDRGWVRGVGQGRSMDAVTFTRASVGKYVDQDGIVQDAANGVPRFDWASTAQVANRNLLSYTEQFDNGVWSKSNATVSADSSVAPDGFSTADTLTFSTTNANIRQNLASQLNTYTFSAYLKAGTMTSVVVSCPVSATANRATVNLSTNEFTAIGSSVIATSCIDVGDDWKRVSITAVGESTSANGSGFSSPNTTGTFYAWGAQLELGDTATTYQSIGAQVPTSTPLAANPTSNGLLIEESRTNRILWCRDATQANWTKTNVTAAKDQTGIDGVANAASSLTATANDGTCIQTITLASGSRTGSVYLKRITGTGNVQVSLDGSTYSTVDLSASEWRRIVLSGTVTNPTVGIKIAVSGDAVAMDYGQVEDGAFATSPILTTTASVTRAADFCQIPLATLKQFFPTDVSWSQNALYGTFNFNFIRGSYPSSSTEYRYFVLNAGGGANEYVLVRNRADNGGGSGPNNPFGITLVANTSTKIAIAFDYRNQIEESSQDEQSLADNTLSLTGSLYNYDRLTIGNTGRTTVGYVAQCWIKQITYIPKVLNISQLQALTKGPV